MWVMSEVSLVPLLVLPVAVCTVNPHGAEHWLRSEPGPGRTSRRMMEMERWLAVPEKATGFGCLIGGTTLSCILGGIGVQLLVPIWGL
jgi:hypothetical protein